MNKNSRGLLIFDGQCGFCRRWIRYMNRFKHHPDSVAWQETDLQAVGLTPEQCTAAVQWVGPDGVVASGSDAAARVLIVAGLPWSVAGRIVFVPGIRAIAQRSYRWVANNRYRFRGDPLPE